MQSIAKSSKGECLSKEYINANTKLKWRCERNHVWFAVPESIKSGTWCPDCGGRKRLTIEEMKGIACKRKGKCLSDVYFNARTSLDWQCAKGHTWRAAPDTIKSGSWCPYCIGRHQTINDIQKLANSKGGICLSEKYNGCESHLMFECKNKHRWKCTPSNLKRGKWCPYCYGNIKLTLKNMQSFAKAKGGKCLSEEYNNVDSKLKWQCSKGHIWKTTPYVIRRLNCWCPYCSNNAPLTINEMKEMAISKGGKCLSNIYKNNSFNLLWECVEGHKWKARPSAIKLGTWCPICSTLKSEKKCRKIFEHIFNKNFPKGRPTWLKNQRGNQMELDGYCKELNLAFEYHGEQHFKKHRFFHTRQSFEDRKLSDKLKRELCKEHGVILIEIPYTVDYENLEEFIVNQCAPDYLFSFTRKNLSVMK